MLSLKEFKIMVDIIMEKEQMNQVFGGITNIDITLDTESNTIADPETCGGCDPMCW